MLSTTSANERVILCGYLNTSLCNPLDMPCVNNFKNILYAMDFFPVIDKPTRLSPENTMTKYSLIDHI